MWWTREPNATRARARAGEQPLAGAWTEGHAMHLDQVVTLIFERASLAAAPM
jgi:hypothetical protein